MSEILDDWIQYFPRGENPVEMPTTGFVEFIDTFDESIRHMMDMSKELLKKSYDV